VNERVHFETLESRILLAADGMDAIDSADSDSIAGDAVHEVAAVEVVETDAVDHSTLIDWSAKTRPSRGLAS